MRMRSILLTAAIILVAASSLQAGEIILYGGTQKTGELEFSSVTEIPDDLLHLRIFPGVAGVAPQLPSELQSLRQLQGTREAKRALPSFETHLMHLSLADS